MKHPAFTWLGALVLLFAACTPAATPTPQPTSAPTATPKPPTPGATSPGPTQVATSAPTAAPTLSPPSGKPMPGGVVFIAQRGDPAPWDPSKYHGSETSLPKLLVFTRLFDLWPEQPAKLCETKLTPVAIKDWRWLDDLTAEFTLHQGIRFHNKPPVNGREVTAKDIAFSVERWRQLPVMAPLMAALKPVEVVDKYTFRIKTDAPWGGMPLETMGYAHGVVIIPEEAGGPKQELWDFPDKSYMGSGPFMFESWQPGVGWSMVRNPNYYKAGKPYVDKIRQRVMPDMSTRMAALRSGQLTVEAELSVSQVEGLKATNPELQVLGCPGGLTQAGDLTFNTVTPPFDNVLVRRAVSMAIDREVIVKTLYRGRALVFAVVRPGFVYALEPKDLPPDVRQYVEYHPDRAKQLLAQAGYPKGFNTTLNLSVGYGGDYYAVTEAISAMLANVGINTSLKVLDRGLYNASCSLGKYPAGQICSGPIINLTPEDINALRWASKDGRGVVNGAMAPDPEYDRVYEEFRRTRDEAKRVELARQLQIRHVDQAPRVVLPSIEQMLVAQANARGLRFAATTTSGWAGQVLENIWLAR